MGIAFLILLQLIRMSVNLDPNIKKNVETCSQLSTDFKKLYEIQGQDRIEQGDFQSVMRAAGEIKTKKFSKIDLS
jgi:hypothetical protein